MKATTVRLPREKPTVIAIGAGHFAQSLRRQGVTVVQVDWRPPPSDPRVQRALDLLG